MKKTIALVQVSSSGELKLVKECNDQDEAMKFIDKNPGKYLVHLICFTKPIAK